MTTWAAIWLVLGAVASAGASGDPVPDTVRAEVVARIGGATTGDVLFERIEALEVDDRGRVYVLDGLAHRLTAFGSSGAGRWTVGREGQGPGEFTAPVGLTWSPEGRLWVVDPENHRVTSVTPEGEIVGTRPLSAGFSLSPWPGRFDQAGRFYSYVESPDGSYDYRMAVYDADLERVGVLSPPTPDRTEQFFEGTTARGSHMRARVPFTPSLVWRLDSRGQFISAWTAEPAFRGPSGTVRLDPAGSSSGPRVSPRERRDAIDGLARFARRGGRIEEARIPDRKPVLSTFVLDPRDRVWALLSPEDGSRDSRFEVLDPDRGRRVTVVVPARVAAFPTPVVRGGWLVCVERDEFGIETVVLVDVTAAG